MLYKGSHVVLSHFQRGKLMKKISYAAVMKMKKTMVSEITATSFLN